MAGENGSEAYFDFEVIHLKIDGLEKELKSGREEIKTAAKDIVTELRQIRTSLIFAITSLVKTMGMIVVVLVVALTGLKYLVPHVLQ